MAGIVAYSFCLHYLQDDETDQETVRPTALRAPVAASRQMEEENLTYISNSRAT